MKRDYVELDVILRWRPDSEAFDLTLIYDHPEEVEDTPYLVDEPIGFNTVRLSDLVENVDQYGAELSTMLYRNPEVVVAVDRALRATGEYPVHLRLLIDAAAPARYHAIRWESLRDPSNEFALATKSRIYFSRYFSSSAQRRLAPLAREGQLTALVAVADPTGLSDYDTLGAPARARVDVAAELNSARKVLPNIAIQTLPDEHDRDARATLDQIMERLEGRGDHGVNLLYLVCHGMVTDEPKLLLEKPNGTVDEVSATAFADRIASLAVPPTVAALCSCQSAGAGDAELTSQAEPLAPFGPLLAQAGVAVVLAMQGNATIPTASTFLSEFFDQLAFHGLADQAASDARRRVQRRPDWWMPVLFSRLRRGRPWYEPRFGRARRQKFDDLWSKMAEGDCTPVLGSGIASEIFLPQRHELAQNWVKRRQMPITHETHNDLAKVAQYLSVASGPDMPHTELRSFLRADLRTKYAKSMPELNWNEPLVNIIRHVWERRRDQLGDDEPYTILASLELPIYVTTSWTNLLETALTEIGHKPEVRSFDWLRDRFEEDELPEPTSEHPLVYHVFGSLDRPSTIVLTEDDYFAWLRTWMRRLDADKTDSIPGPVKKALTDSSLLFLGYRLDDWEFRIMFQSVKSFAGTYLHSRHGHVGVQLRPETATVDPEAALDYLERYLSGDYVNIYWGSSRQFLQDLRDTRPVP